MAVNPTNSASSAQAVQQYRQVQQDNQRQQQPAQAATEDRISIRNRQSRAETAGQNQRAESPNRRNAVAAYENASRAGQQAPAPEKQKEKILRNTQA